MTVVHAEAGHHPSFEREGIRRGPLPSWRAEGMGSPGRQENLRGGIRPQVRATCEFF
ncbi:hypothetical protein OCOJLMKI_4697 [Methylobacterium iners]|uniref:Uncharacterized protein n=1 Tax=Methylobacterium iners TaxID=418707 RepID=A0ABQ4S347_9HYPH|nr:hypothetical protein OCOJLMKI_4697 [Methylobacterium iners]